MKKNKSTVKDSLEFAKCNFEDILCQIDGCQLSERVIRHWRIYSNIRNDSRPYKKYLTFFVLLWTGYLLINNIDFSSQNKVGNFAIQTCLMESSNLNQILFRPAEDCSVCSDVHEIEKLSHVDPLTFEQRYAYSGRPLIVKDGVNNWTAMDTFSYDFFKQLYANKDASNCQFFPYKTEFRSLRDVFNMSANRALLESGTKPWYVGWSNCDQTIGETLRQHYSRPYFLPEHAENEKTDWIFMGSNGYGAPMHIDDVGFPSWQAQVQGKKLWILEPPRECLYVCKRLEVVVNPGEIIILDTNRWYHQTLIVSDNISITIGAEYD